MMPQTVDDRTLMLLSQLVNDDYMILIANTHGLVANAVK